MKKEKKKDERKLEEVSYNFQRSNIFATLVPIIPRFRGICPNC
nr:MAG TPA: Reverse gyrase zinc finger [Caudoviricetes sp.]